MTTVWLAVDLEDDEGEDLDYCNLQDWQMDDVIADLVSEVENVGLSSVETECEECSSCGGHEVCPRVDSVTSYTASELRQRFGGQATPSMIGAPTIGPKPRVY